MRRLVPVPPAAPRPAPARFRPGILARILLAALALSALGGGLAASTPEAPPAAGEGPRDYPALRNVVRLSEKLYSGGMPQGDEGFRTLAAWGVRTVITVDGAPPDVGTARRHGMRYVHLPFGYDGCPSPVADAVVRAVRDLPGPVYLHCHLGRHRSPAAAAMARIALDGLSNEEAVREMERAGTGKNYIGLYADVRAYRPPAPEALDRVPALFPETAPTPPLVEAMVQMEARFDRLAALRGDDWRAGAGGDPAHEALQLRELYTELNRTEEVRRSPRDFRRWMREGERAGRELEAALRRGRRADASAALARVASGCGACHARYRNVPRAR